MGPTLNTAAGMDAYALTDRGTWLSFENRGDLEILVEGDPRLFNQYGVILVNPAKHPHVKAELGQTVHRLAALAARASRRSPATRSTASSCSSRTPSAAELSAVRGPRSWRPATIAHRPSRRGLDAGGHPSIAARAR